MEDERALPRSQEMTQRYTAMVGDKRVDVEITRTTNQIEARVGGRTYNLEIEAVAAKTYWFNWNNQSIEVIVAATDEGFTVTIGGHQIPVELLDTRKALSRIADHGREGVAIVRAPMPGRIVRVLASENSLVEANQGIVVMEAMKMQNEIRSPKRGRIQQLNVSEGTAVISGQPIAAVE